MSTPISRCSGCGLEVGHLPRCPYDEAVGVSAGDGTPGPARPDEAVGFLWRHEKYGLHVAQPDEKMHQEWSVVGPVYLGDSGGPREAADLDLAASVLVALLNGHCVFPPDDVRALAARLRSDALRAELGRAPNGWEEAATEFAVAEAAVNAEMRQHGERGELRTNAQMPSWERYESALDALLVAARADAERPESDKVYHSPDYCHGFSAGYEEGRKFQRWEDELRRDAERREPAP